MDEPAFPQDICDRLAALGFDDEDFVTYVATAVCSSLEEEEIEIGAEPEDGEELGAGSGGELSALVETLLEGYGIEGDDSIGPSVVAWWTGMQRAKRTAADAAKACQAAEREASKAAGVVKAKELEAQRNSVLAEQRANADATGDVVTGSHMTAAARIAKQFQTEESSFDGAGDLQAVDNKSWIKEADKANRMASAEAHQKKVNKDKADLAKDKLRKEERKTAVKKSSKANEKNRGGRGL